MALPTTLDPAAPGGSDPLSQGDDQIRAFKLLIADLFGILTDPTSLTAAMFSITAAGVVTMSADKLIDKDTTPPTVDAQYTNKKYVDDEIIAATISPSIPAGSLMLFMQATAPTGWTIDVTHDNKALRIVSTGHTSAGNDAFTTVFGVAKPSIVDSHVLLTAEMPAHTHLQQTNTVLDGGGGNGPALVGGRSLGGTTQSTGGGGGHVHNLSADLQYVDGIIASKD